MTSPSTSETVHERQRLAITVRGVVQGVGFRPFVYNTARTLRLGGWVQNRSDTLEMEVEGTPEQLAAFVERVRHRHPPQAKIDFFESRPIPCDGGETELADEFQIRASNTEAAPQPVVPADMATCSDCLEEIADSSARRHQYPFTNCTNCGPRWSIITQLPYDRPRTTMASFEMCDDCQQEYEEPADRRFHAQPIACPRCGPQLRLLGDDASASARADEALQRAVDALLAGKILAMKGIGGFQLLVDATNARAVSRLRERKRRPTKPFAVMIGSIDEVRRCCDVSDKEAATLTSAEAPILLLRRTLAPDNDDVATEVAPGNPYLGVMLPYTPLHHLIVQRVQRSVVCTSGNLSEEPMAITSEDARQRLGHIADLILTHDRPIQRPVDDSVARVLPSGLQLLRRARGYAPLSIALPFAGPTTLALGGHLKNTVGLSLGNRAVLSPHVGDLDHPLSVEVHRAAARDLVDFFQVTPEAVACDLHPDYASTQHAESLAAQWDVPLIRVQHHHAHVAACMVDNDIRGPVLGLSWDGTGYGPDGSVWGGETLVCEGANFTRVAHLRPFRLPGGDAAVREPRRSALGVLFAVLGEPGTEQVLSERIPPGDGWFSPTQRKTLYALMRSGTNAPLTTSLGRLFDAVAALCQLADTPTFEGEAAMALEFAADTDEPNAYPLPLSDCVPAVADWEPLVQAVLADRAAGVPVQRISGRFHNALANLAVAVTRRFRYTRVILTGGCFQNRVLTRKITNRLVEEGVKVYTHRNVPPGDGGIALGQIFVAAQRIKD